VQGNFDSLAVETNVVPDDSLDVEPMTALAAISNGDAEDVNARLIFSTLLFDIVIQLPCLQLRAFSTLS